VKKKKKKPVVKKSFFLSKYFSGQEFIILSFIAAAGLILRIIYINEISDAIYIKYPASDSLLYLQWGREIAAGSCFGDRVFYMSPVYSYFLALVSILSDNTVYVMQVIQALLNTATIFIIYYAAKRIFSQPAAYISASLAALYYIFIFYSGLILIEILHTFILSLFLLYLLKVSNEIKVKHFITAGLLFGLLILFRGNIILFLPVFLIWLYFRHNREIKNLLKPALLFLAGVFLPLIVVALNNYIAEKDFVILTSNGGINFYLGNNPDATGIYMNPKEFSLVTDLTGHNYAERQTGRDMTPGEVSDFWFSQGLQYIRENPLAAAELFIKKILLFIDDSENPQSAAMDSSFFAEDSVIMKLPLPGFYFIFLFAIAGILLSLHKSKEFNILLLFLLVYIIASALFFVTGRFRVPVTPIFVIFSGAGVSALYYIIKEKKFRLLVKPAVVVAVLLFLNFTVTPQFTFSSYDAFNHLGKVHYENKEFDKAIEYYSRSIELKDDYGTYTALGNALAAKGDFKKAWEAYTAAINRNPGYELAWFNLGSLNIQMRRHEEALSNFNKVIELNPSFEEAYRNAGIIYYMQGNYKKALEYFEEYLSFVKDENTRSTVQQDIEEIKRQINGK
jgi:tetratricopeptide (TPR) repeat protein